MLRGQAGIADNPAHGECLDRVMPRNGDLKSAITHDDVLALPEDPESGLL